MTVHSAVEDAVALLRVRLLRADVRESWRPLNDEIFCGLMRVADVAGKMLELWNIRIIANVEDENTTLLHISRDLSSMLDSIEEIRVFGMEVTLIKVHRLYIIMYQRFIWLLMNVVVPIYFDIFVFISLHPYENHETVIRDYLYRQ